MRGGGAQGGRRSRECAGEEQVGEERRRRLGLGGSQANMCRRDLTCDNWASCASERWNFCAVEMSKEA
jgi:hypothetical protein